MLGQTISSWVEVVGISGRLVSVNLGFRWELDWLGKSVGNKVAPKFSLRVERVWGTSFKIWGKGFK
jgi:hypothetical protein